MHKKSENFLVYDPYMHNFGGGEKYLLDVVNALIEKGNNVVIYSNYSLPALNSNFLDRFGYKLNDKITIIRPRFKFRLMSYLYLTFITLRFKFFVTVTNEFPHVSFSKNNIAILQYPYIKVGLLPRIRKYLHYRLYCRVVVYSEYIKQIVLSENIKVNSISVISPFVEGLESLPLKPNPQKIDIICVGRFIENENSKGQEHAIRAFKIFYDKNGLYKGTLHLVGGASFGSESFIDRLKLMSKGYPIEIHTNATSTTKIKLYRKSRIYWHLAGYDKDLVKSPGSAEHFGITVLEAIKYNCIPLCYRAGGPVEILGETNDKFFWESLEELVEKSEIYINSQNMGKSLLKLARSRFDLYSKANFYKQITHLIND